MDVGGRDEVGREDKRHGERNKRRTRKRKREARGGRVKEPQEEKLKEEQGDGCTKSHWVVQRIGCSLPGNPITDAPRVGWGQRRSWPRVLAPVL